MDDVEQHQQPDHHREEEHPQQHEEAGAALRLLHGWELRERLRGRQWAR